MKLAGTRESYQYYSGKASDVCRQLSLAALGIIWIFKTDQPGGVIRISHPLLWSAGCAVLALAFDLLQYIYGSIAWGLFNRNKELKLGLNEEADFGVPRGINWPTNGFFYLKLASVGACYGFLLHYLYSALFR